MTAGRDDRVHEALRRRARLLESVAEIASDDVERLAEWTAGTLRRGGKLMFCGNGGSAADAQHLAAEYVVRLARRRPPMAALALTADSAVLTATGNDLGFDEIFERQIRAIGRPGDLLVLHSTTGRSPNLLRAADGARRMGVATAALLAADGGELARHVDLVVLVPTEDPALAQEVHLAIGHLVCAIVEDALAPACEAP